MFLTRGLDFRSSMQAFDPLGSFRMALDGPFLQVLPWGLWAIPNGQVRTLLLGGVQAALEPGSNAGAPAGEPRQLESASILSGAPMTIYDIDDDCVRLDSQVTEGDDGPDPN
jgi:hypothetical protein